MLNTLERKGTKFFLLAAKTTPSEKGAYAMCIWCLWLAKPKSGEQKGMHYVCDARSHKEIKAQITYSHYNQGRECTG